jgi:hypothetical protein
MAPLLPLGFAILGLGCTVPLTIGSSELDRSITSSGGDGGAVSTSSDAGSDTEDAGQAIDAGIVEDAGPICVSPGFPGIINYANCCSGDVREGLCNDPRAWNCSDFRVCTNNGVSCFSTGHPCTGYGDCCTEVCYQGFCASSPFPMQVTLTNPSQSCKLIQEFCSNYSDCCSQNCAFGQCAPAPTTTGCGEFLADCTSSTDCCSQECDHGSCRDNTLPWVLQTAGIPMGGQSSTNSVPSQGAVAPQFQLNRVDDFAGPNPVR